MANTELLTLEDIEIFSERLKATVEAANASEKLRSYITRFVDRALGADDSVPPLPDAGPARREPRGPRRQRQAGIEPESLLQYFKGAAAKEGLQIGDIVKSSGLERDRVRAAMQKLRSAKKLKMTGDRSGARWYLT